MKEIIQNMENPNKVVIRSTYKQERGGHSMYFGVWLLVPAFLSLLYGKTAYRAMSALGYQYKNVLGERIRMALPVLLLFTFWCMYNFPLPVLYALAFAGKMFHLYRKNWKRYMEMFIVNLTHLMTMALHIILIGVISLLTDTAMNSLLQVPLWRIATCGVILAADNLICWLLPRLTMLLGIIKTRTDREEVKPFMLFLWFANLSLMIDSILCISDNSWRLLPLFLVGSTLFLEVYLIGFLRHLYSILKIQYLEEEYCRLQEELEHQERSASELRSRTDTDPMTGIFSRRYIMEQADLLLRSRKPFSLVYIDIDQLKQINDKEGHDAGDLYLVRFTGKFGACLRKTDIFARIGGDEFAVLLPDCTSEMAEERMKEIRRHLSEDIRPALSFSYGIASAMETDGRSVEKVLKRADMAMYQDKQTRTK